MMQGYGTEKERCLNQCLCFTRLGKKHEMPLNYTDAAFLILYMGHPAVSPQISISANVTLDK